jgi:undecaprenyl-diphosphatase
VTANVRGHWPNLLARVKSRDRNELALLVGGVVVLLLLFTASKLASEVLEGDTQQFDKQILTALRDPANPSRPIGPPWLLSGALDITALGSPRSWA